MSTRAAVRTGARAIVAALLALLIVHAAAAQNARNGAVPHNLAPHDTVIAQRAETAPGAGLAQSPPSTCYGTYWNGRLEDGVPLPLDGPNFRTYTPQGNQLGRTFVHSAIYDILIAAYEGAHQTLPDVTYIYGETGFKNGGPIPPHRTHQTGLSVDFFVPLRDAAGRSVPIPIDASNKWGYDIAFDQAGRLGDLWIDFDALAEHLYHLSEAAKARKIGIRVVILDPPLQPKLLGTRRGAAIRHLPYMKERAWSRHDNHYHVDFIVPCKPLPVRK